MRANHAEAWVPVSRRLRPVKVEPGQGRRGHEISARRAGIHPVVARPAVVARIVRVARVIHPVAVAITKAGRPRSPRDPTH